MNWAIKRFEPGSDEQKMLAVAAAVLTAKSPNGYRYYVGTTYFDYGQDWKWTTVLCEGDKWGGYQALNPREQEDILLADINDIPKICDEVLADKYCPDRVKEATA